jgi:hypothetical protein
MASANSTDDPGELFFFAFPSVTLSARGLPLSVDSLQPRRWEEGGPVGDIGLWWITPVQLCVSLQRIFQSAVIEK